MVPRHLDWICRVLPQSCQLPRHKGSLRHLLQEIDDLRIKLDVISLFLNALACRALFGRKQVEQDMWSKLSSSLSPLSFDEAIRTSQRPTRQR